MSNIEFTVNAGFASGFGILTAAIGVGGIWGSRYISKLQNLTYKSAAVAGGASFVSLFAIFSVFDLVGDNGDKQVPLIILGSAALSILGNKILINRDISILSGSALTVVPQIVIIAFLALSTVLQG